MLYGSSYGLFILKGSLSIAQEMSMPSREGRKSTVTKLILTQPRLVLRVTTMCIGVKCLWLLDKKFLSMILDRRYTVSYFRVFFFHRTYVQHYCLSDSEFTTDIHVKHKLMDTTSILRQVSFYSIFFPSFHGYIIEHFFFVTRHLEACGRISG